jgi:hypothetical protein
MKMRLNVSLVVLLLTAICTPELTAQGPGIITYQGRMQVEGTNFTGYGSFKFALVDGQQNTIEFSGDYTVIGGGLGNTIEVHADYATIGGGYSNRIHTNAWYATIGGGTGNTIQSNANYLSCSTIGGGFWNSILTSSSYATIPGGRENSATNYAFAAGRRAKANHTGSFVWADSTDADMASTGANSVTMRASGGTRIFTDSGTTAGVSLSPGSGSWTSISDRNAKENFKPVAAQEILEKVSALSLTSWNYKSQDSSIRHIGPMAQDFHAAFRVGESETGITSIDADGVALAAIQGLNQKVEARTQEAEARSRKLEAENSELKQRLAQLEQLVDSLMK